MMKWWTHLCYKSSFNHFLILLHVQTHLCILTHHYCWEKVKGESDGTCYILCCMFFKYVKLSILRRYWAGNLQKVVYGKVFLIQGVTTHSMFELNLILASPFCILTITLRARASWTGLLIGADRLQRCLINAIAFNIIIKRMSILHDGPS